MDRESKGWRERKQETDQARERERERKIEHCQLFPLISVFSESIWLVYIASFLLLFIRHQKEVDGKGSYYVDLLGWQCHTGVLYVCYTLFLYSGPTAIQVTHVV